VLDVKVFLGILNTQQTHRDAYHKKSNKIVPLVAKGLTAAIVKASECESSQSLVCGTQISPPHAPPFLIFTAELQTSHIEARSLTWLS